MRQSNKSSPQGILFDMDGVLLITGQSSAQSWQEVCRQFAPILNCSIETLSQALQESRRAYKREIEYNPEKQRRDRLEPFETRQETVESALRALGTEDKAIAAEMVRVYEMLRDIHRHLAPHALDVLQEMRNRAIPLALISNGNATYQRRKIAQHQLAPFFDVILIEQEFGVEKPDQRIFLHALNQLHTSAHETWMIGDDLMRDIAGSQQVGIFAIWCDFASKDLLDTSDIHPDKVIHDLSEVLDMLTS
jgi:putative hydrolase of the HAD superfamily